MDRLKLPVFSRQYALALLLVGLVSAAGAYLAVQWVVSDRIADQRVGLAHALDYTVDALQDEASGATAIGAAMLMGLNEWPLKLVALGDVPPDASHPMEKLAVARALFEADGAYVISANGVIVAHSTKDKSSTGTNVSFRPYFKNAMQGTANVYAAVGTVSNERGLYYAAPLRRDTRQTSEVIGVVMLKMSSAKIDQMLRFAGNDAVLLSPQGVVFASTREPWLLQLALPADAQRIADIRALKQFGSRFEAQEPQILPFDPSSAEVAVGGRRYLVLRKLVEWNDPAGQWQVVSLHNTGTLVSGVERWAVGMAAFAVLALMGLLLAQVLVERRRSAAARARYNMMGAALDVSPLSVVITDVQGYIQWANPQFEKDTGYSAQELERRHISLVADAKAQGQDFMAMAKVVLSGKAWRGELFNKRKDGSFFPGHTLISPIVGQQGKITGFVGLQEDTTQAVALQEQLVRAKEAADAANRSKGHFLANMSHEIRTPMNAIIGMAYLVRQTNLNPRQVDYVSKIQQSGQHLLAIIDDILDVSKVEAGKLKIERVPFELSNVLDQVINVVSGKAEAKGLALVCSVSQEVPHRLVGDPLRLGQILINYANNAIKFTSAGSINIQVSVQQRLGLEVLARFTVVDTGIGLTDEQMRRLFQSFEQADTSTTREFGGTGLGLAISKGLAALMGGEVGVSSQPGAGATFWFTARLGLTQPTSASEDELDRVNDGDFVNTQPDPLDALLPLAGARILLVEDNDINQQVAGELLRAVGFEVDIADNGLMGVQRVAAMNDAQSPFDLVLMDLQMPVMDGLSATAEIRKDPRNADLPIAAMTANAMVQDKNRCLQAGMRGFVTKPIDPDELWRVLALLIQPRVGLGLVRDSRLDEIGFVADQRSPEGAIPTFALEIEGLDTRLGLRRVMGKQDLYVSLLRKFIASQAGALQRVRDALDAGDRPLAERLAHTLKGVAGNIGAVKLEVEAAALEAALRDGAGGPEIDGLIRLPMHRLDAFIQALQSRLPALTPERQVTPAADKLMALCQRLATLLAQQDFEAEDYFAQNRAVFQTAFGRDCEPIKLAIDRFNFEEALLELKQACGKKAISLERGFVS